jgi:glucose-6-phosphate isomerase
MFAGEIINQTENRPAWHVQLRKPVEDESNKPVFDVKRQIKAFSD